MEHTKREYVRMCVWTLNIFVILKIPIEIDGHRRVFKRLA